MRESISRRRAMRSIGAATVIGTSLSSGASAEDGKSNVQEKVLYSDKNGEIVQVGPHSYVIRGAKSRKSYEFLSEKRKEILMDHDGPSIMSTKSGSDNDSGLYNGHSWAVESELTAFTSTTEAEVEGMSSAKWYGEAYWVEDPVEVEEIEMSSNIAAKFNDLGGSWSISVPPAYTENSSSSRLEATLSNSWTDETGPSLAHEQGAVNFYGGSDSCLEYVEQDDTVKFDYGTEVEYYGVSVRLEFDHCDWL